MRRIVALAVLLNAVFAASVASAQLGTDLTSNDVPTTRTVSTTSPLGGGGALSGNLTLTCTTCATAAAAFATDNVIIRSDGTGRGMQFTGITVDDSDRVGLGTAVPTHTLTLASASTGMAVYNTADQVTNFERWTMAASGNRLLIASAGGGTGSVSRGIRLQVNNGAITNDDTAITINPSGGASGAQGVTFATTSALSSTSVVQKHVVIAPTVNQTSGTGGVEVFAITPTLTAVGSAGAKLFLVNPGAVTKYFIDSDGAQDSDSTITAGGTTGAQTISKPCGTVNFAAAASSLVVTNTLVTANSVISVVARANDATCSVKDYEPAAGSFTIRMNAACTAETSVGFCVLDKN